MTGRSATLLLVLSIGCDYGGLGSSGSRGYGGGYYDDGYVEYDRTETTPTTFDTMPAEGTELVLTRAFMAGDMGDVRGFAATPFEVQAVRSEGMDFLRFDAIDESSGMWVMAQVEIRGGLDHESFRPGASLDIGGYDYGSTPGVYASGLGCSGPAVNTFTFDQSPDAMHVEVTSGSVPTHRQFVITLEFGTQVVDLSFEVAPGPTPDARVSAAALYGSVGGVAVSGGSTFLSELHHESHSTLLLERQEADGRIVRVRLDIPGGLGALAPGSYSLADGLSLAASTASADVDPSYTLAPSALDVRVSSDGTGDRTLDAVATFASGGSLELHLVYR